MPACRLSNTGPSIQCINNNWWGPYDRYHDVTIINKYIFFLLFLKYYTYIFNLITSHRYLHRFNKKVETCSLFRTMSFFTNNAQNYLSIVNTKCFDRNYANMFDIQMTVTISNILTYRHNHQFAQVNNVKNAMDGISILSSVYLYV